MIVYVWNRCCIVYCRIFEVHVIFIGKEKPNSFHVEQTELTINLNLDLPVTTNLRWVTI